MRQNSYKTVLVIVTGLLLLSWIFKVQLLTKIGFGVALLSILFPVAADWIDWAWMKFALALGWINSRILLTVLYFLFLLPIAWVSRLFTKDPLQLKSGKTKTVYIDRNHQYIKKDLENIW